MTSTLSPGEEQDLFTAALGNNRPALDRLLLSSYADARKLSARYARSDAPYGSEDLCQEAFITLVRNWHKWQGRSRFSTWAHSVLENAMRSLVKREIAVVTRHETEFNEYTEILTSWRCGDPLEAVLHRGDLEELQQALSKLKPRMRLLLRLRFGLDSSKPHSLEATSQLLGIPPGTVKSRQHRALSELHKLMGGNGARMRYYLSRC